MLIFALIFGVISVVLVALYAIKKNFLLFICFGVALYLAIILPLFGERIPRSANYLTTVYEYGIDGKKRDIDIRFEQFEQHNNIVTINGYYTNTQHWTDFKMYDYHDKTITIQIPEGQQFEYSLVEVKEQPKPQVVIREE